MLRYAATTTGSPQAAWRLIARPDQWSAWAPHLRGAWGLAGEDGWVRQGGRGAARLLWAVPVPAVVLDVDDGRSWTWRVGPVVMAHHVEDDDGGSGCTVAVEMSAPLPVEAALRASYGPVVAVLVRNLARLAAARDA